MPAEPSPLCFPNWSLIPFITMLLSIAILPMTVSNWWDSNRNKTILSVVVSLPVLAVVMPCDPNLLMHSLLDYVSFLTLLGALFVISGGICERGVCGDAPGEYDFPGSGSVASQYHRHDRRLHAADPAVHARESGEATQVPPDHFFHIRGQQHRWIAHSSRRSTAISGFLAGRAVPLDAYSDSTVGTCGNYSPARLQHFRSVRFCEGRHRNAGRARRRRPTAPAPSC